MNESERHGQRRLEAVVREQIPDHEVAFFKAVESILTPQQKIDLYVAIGNLEDQPAQALPKVLEHINEKLGFANLIAAAQIHPEVGTNLLNTLAGEVELTFRPFANTV